MAGPSIIITGASGGIGRAAALKLARRGVALTLASRNYTALSSLADEVRRLGGQAIAVPTDVTQRAQVSDMVSEAVATHGRIDGLVNCAGVGVIRPALDLTDEDIDQAYAVNTRGVILAAQAAGAHMLKSGGGRIVTPVGTMGRFVMRGSAAYSASKWGAVGALKAMATEWQRQGVSFTLLYLGGVDTPFWDGIDMKVQRDKMLTADDAAEAVVYALMAPGGSAVNEILLQPESHQLM
jgi:NAD(P)-dependent dehydrogenase (short-subunit alcohol dehydrogenase family)